MRMPRVEGIEENVPPRGLWRAAKRAGAKNSGDYGGTAGDCEVKEIFFVDNGFDGVFVITASYIVEAAEGTGARFRSMIETFRVLKSSDAVQIEKIANQFAEAYFEGDDDTLKQFLAKSMLGKLKLVKIQMDLTKYRLLT